MISPAVGGRLSKKKVGEEAVEEKSSIEPVGRATNCEHDLREVIKKGTEASRRGKTTRRGQKGCQLLRNMVNQGSARKGKYAA